MKLLLEIISISTFANILTWHSTEISNFILDRLRLNFKPFSCNVCLAFWAGFVWNFFSTFDPISAIIFGGVCYLASHLVFLLLDKRKL